MRRALLGLLVASVAVSGGCNALTSDANGDDGATLTPVPVNGGDATASGVDELPPGVSPSGRIDPRRVEDAHLDYLQNRSFTLLRTRTDGDPDETDVRRSLVRASADTQHRIRSVEGDRRIELYANLSREYVRTRNLTTGRVERYRSSVGNYTLVRRAIARSVAKYVDETADDVEEVERNGSVFYRLQFGGEGDVPRSLDDEIAATGNYSATLYLTPEGLIRTVVVRIRPVADAPTETTRIQFRQVGNTTVERPDWVEHVTLSRSSESG